MQHLNNNNIPPALHLLLPPAGPQFGNYGPGSFGSYSHPPGPDPANPSMVSRIVGEVEMQQMRILNNQSNLHHRPFGSYNLHAPSST